MNTKEFTKNENALSPVIAVILMVAITVVLAAVLYTWGDHTHTDKDTPQIDTIAQKNDTNYKVRITSEGHGALSIIAINYILLDEKGYAVPGEQGRVRNIYGLNFNDRSTNITYIDLDRNGCLSIDDYFMIKHKNNGGPARDGYVLLLKFVITGDKMNGRGTKLE